MIKNILVMDIGGTFIKYAVMNHNKLTNIKQVPTLADKEGFDMIRTLTAIIDSVILIHRLDGIAISTAGIVDTNTGQIIYANNNLPNYSGTEIQKIIKKKYRIPCTVENDVNCAALAEREAQALENFMMITVGTGLGGAIVVDGKILRGVNGSAGEVGYILHQGMNIEKTVSTSALVNNVPNAINGLEVFDNAKRGDHVSQEAIEKLCDNLGQILHNFACILNPGAFVLGGGIMEQEDYLRPLIQKYFKLHTQDIIFNSTEIRFAKLGNHAGMIGAYQNYMTKTKQMNMLDIIKGGLVVSCQALEEEPLHSPFIMGRMAIAAKQAGAVGIRAQGVDDIIEIKKQVNLPIIGIIKRNYEDSEVYITASRKEITELLSTDCEMIALDATSRRRPNDENMRDLVKMIHDKGRLAMADCSTFEECIVAQEIGFDCVSTTLCGYTEYSELIEGPNFDLMKKLTQTLEIPLIAEGKINTPEDLEKVYELGVHSAVVGGAITRPQEIAARFVKVLKNEY